VVAPTPPRRSRWRSFAIGLGLLLAAPDVAAETAAEAPEGAADEAASKRFQTTAQRLHERGVHCMDTLKQKKCTLEAFEALIDEPTNERELVTDGLLRLVKLYGAAGRDSDIKQMLRVFWEAGRTRSHYGHLAYSARYMPEDIDVYGGGDIQAVAKAGLTAKLPPDLFEYATTCNETRQEQIKDLWLFRRAKRLAKKEKITVNAAIAKIHAKNLEKRKKAEARSKEREAQAAKSGAKQSQADPVFNDGPCVIAKIFGQKEFADWERVSFALNHKNPGRSVAFFNIPGVEERLAKAVQKGKLKPAGKNLWAIPGLKHTGKQVLLARLDLDELTLAAADLMPGIVSRSQARKRSMNSELYKLLGQVPQDAAFFGAATQKAVRDLGFGSMKKGRRTLAEWFLPRPEGIQMAGVIQEHLGLFMRMPTSMPIKADMLIGFARRMIAREASDEDGNDDLLRLLDVAQAGDRRAVLMSYVLSKKQILDMMER